jgi:S-adenosylmethionine hydrolase
VTLLTDFGDDDYYVAAVKGVILSRAPGVTLVDIGHQVAPGDVEAGGFLLAAAGGWFPAGSVHLGVVDPGVGSARRILAVEAGGRFYVAPDNGLLGMVLAGGLGTAAAADPEAGGDATAPAEVRAVDRPDLYLPGPGATFHGRDRFAPVAAALAAGEPLAALGPEIDDPVRLPAEPPRIAGPPGAAGTVLTGRVAWIDRFGNLVTDLPAGWAGDRPCLASLGAHAARQRVDHFAAIPFGGEPAIVPGSLGTLELVLADASLARRWRVERGAAITVRLG